MGIQMKRKELNKTFMILRFEKKPFEKSRLIGVTGAACVLTASVNKPA